MNDQDLAIAAQMRAWLKERMIYYRNSDEEEAGYIILGLADALSKLLVLTSKRWRVVEGTIAEVSCGYEIRDDDHNDLLNCPDPGTRVLIVTEEK